MLYRIVVELAEVVRRLPEADAKNLLLLAYILEQESSDFHNEIRVALRQRDYETVERLLDQLVKGR